MQRNIIWKGLDADTTENCAVCYVSGGIVARSEIMGWSDGLALSAEYVIRLTAEWQVLKFEVTAQAGNKPQAKYAMKRAADGKWLDTAGEENLLFAGCNYIDITLTPLTNSLPINGLGLAIGESCDIVVVYIDVMADEVRKDRQRYTRTGRLRYRFENDGGNFTADIDVDENGFVTDYPQLFETI